MPTLFDLPRELRDDIIERVILLSRSAPLDVETARQRRKETKDAPRESRSYFGPDYVDFDDSTDFIAPSLSLLLVNRQLSSETKSALKRLLPNGLRYELDVMLIDARALWATWLSVPALAKQVDTVDVTFRTFGKATGTNPFCNLFMGGDGGPPLIEWCFYYLLEEFAAYGPRWAQPKASALGGKEFSIKTLNINIELGEKRHEIPEMKVPFRDWIDRHRRVMRRWVGYSDDADMDLLEYFLPPDLLATRLVSSIRDLRAMDYHSARYGDLLYETVGDVHIKVYGKPYEDFDLGTWLAHLSQTPGNTFGHLVKEQRLPAFWRWKTEAIGRRRERGLPMPSDVDLIDPAVAARRGP